MLSLPGLHISCTLAATPLLVTHDVFTETLCGVTSVRIYEVPNLITLVLIVGIPRAKPNH